MTRNCSLMFYEDGFGDCRSCNPMCQWLSHNAPWDERNCRNHCPEYYKLLMTPTTTTTTTTTSGHQLIDPTRIHSNPSIDNMNTQSIAFIAPMCVFGVLSLAGLILVGVVLFRRCNRQPKNRTGTQERRQGAPRGRTLSVCSNASYAPAYGRLDVENQRQAEDARQPEPEAARLLQYDQGRPHLDVYSSSASRRGVRGSVSAPATRPQSRVDENETAGAVGTVGASMNELSLPIQASSSQPSDAQGPTSPSHPSDVNRPTSPSHPRHVYGHTSPSHPSDANGSNEFVPNPHGGPLSFTSPRRAAVAEPQPGTSRSLDRESSSSTEYDINSSSDEASIATEEEGQTDDHSGMMRLGLSFHGPTHNIAQSVV